ncbi:unnamed protein product [Protopolystoma xenopodis]|uniref:Uncharacterized protein n=1 Tax=Protopolystoma xenopodis TaxID=117903 RepID=A0A3S5CKP3_9PLAT|nr:unnamed protein product [Protopolystoma xenopodis]
MHRRQYYSQITGYILTPFILLPIRCQTRSSSAHASPAQTGQSGCVPGPGTPRPPSSSGIGSSLHGHAPGATATELSASLTGVGEADWKTHLELVDLGAY